jgi:hypothetical protein
MGGKEMRMRAKWTIFVAVVFLITIFAVPAAAQAAGILVYNGEGQYTESDSRGTFAGLGNKTLQMVVYSSTLPAREQLARYNIVVLPGVVEGRGFSENTMAKLADYLQDGGRLLALGDGETAVAQNNAVNALTTYLRAGLSVNPASLAIETPETAEYMRGLIYITDYIYWDSPLAAGLDSNASIGANYASEVLVSGEALPLVYTMSANGGQVILGTEEIGGGLLVVSGDAAIFNDSLKYADSAANNNVYDETVCSNGALATAIESWTPAGRQFFAASITIGDVFEEYCVGLSDGTLVPEGNNRNQIKRSQRNFSRLLMLAQDYLAAGNTTMALTYLESAYGRCDGTAEGGNDYIAGTGRESLATMLQELIASLRA